MATLKNMTRVRADVRQIARLLQAKAPENHMLAYITPEEAQLLKDRGGSGMPDPETGITSFQEEQYGFNSADITDAYDIGNVTQEAAPPPIIEAPPAYSAGQPMASFDASQFAPPVISAPSDAVSLRQPLPEISFRPTGVTTYGPGYGQPEEKAIDTSRPVEDKNIMARLAETTGLKEETLARLGLGGIQAILGARASTKAAEQGQRGKAEIQALAQPFQARGAELQRQAQAGELTPVGQQQLKTVQAQAAQAASARGGVGAQQTAARVEAIRNQLLQQQSDYGLKLSGIGDQILLGSIRTGLEADRYVNQLATTYYTNIARTLAGTPTVVQYGVTQ
jgi:hypothetical protein